MKDQIATVLRGLFPAVEGSLVGVASFFAFDAASAAWRADLLRPGTGIPALTALVLVAIAGVAYAHFRPAQALWCATAVVMLVIAGLISGDALRAMDSDLTLMSGQWTYIVQRGAHQPSIAVWLGSLLASVALTRWQRARNIWSRGRPC